MARLFCQFFLLLQSVTILVGAFSPMPQQATMTRSRSRSASASASVLTRLEAAESEVSFGTLDGKDVRIGIIRTRWNDKHVTNLVEGAKKALTECNVEEDNIFETEVPGSFELPLAAKFLAMSQTVDAIITVGVLIKGDTMHFEYIAESVSSGLMSVQLATSTPIVFGVLTCLTEAQVESRSSSDNNHGYDWGKTAVEMALLKAEATGALKNNKGAQKLEGLGFNKKEGKKEKSPLPGFF